MYMFLYTYTISVIGDEQKSQIVPSSLVTLLIYIYIYSNYEPLSTVLRKPNNRCVSNYKTDP